MIKNQLDNRDRLQVQEDARYLIQRVKAISKRGEEVEEEKRMDC